MKGRDIIAEVSSAGRVLVHAVTYNMHGKPPPEDLTPLLPRGQYHIYSVGSQESLRSIAKSMARPSKLAWEHRVQEHLGPSYIKLAGCVWLCVCVCVCVLPVVDLTTSPPLPPPARVTAATPLAPHTSSCLCTARCCV